MPNQRAKRQKRESAARRRANRRQSERGSQCVKMPAGLSWYNPKKGVHRIDIVPYTAGAGNPYADEGTEYYERTFFVHKRMGANNRSYTAGKTFGYKDVLQKLYERLLNERGKGDEEVKALRMQERQLYLVFDHAEPDKGVQLWDNATWNFGDLLDERIREADEEFGWDAFYFPDEEGKTLRITISDVPHGGADGGTYLKCTAIDFIDRKKPLPKEILEHGIVLDDLLVQTSDEELTKLYEGEDHDGADDEPPAERPKPTTGKPKPKAKDKPKPTEDVTTAEEAGLSVGDTVNHDEHGECEIMNISGDGTSLTIEDENGDLHKAVGCDEVTVVDPTTETTQEDANDADVSSASADGSFQPGDKVIVDDDWTGVVDEVVDEDTINVTADADGELYGADASSVVALEPEPEAKPKPKAKAKPKPKPKAKPEPEPEPEAEGDGDDDWDWDED